MSGLREAMAVGGMFLWTNAHTCMHTYIQFCNKRPDERVSCCSKTRQAPRDQGCMKQMGSVEKYCCSLRPKHTVCVYVCLKDSVLPADTHLPFAQYQLDHNYIAKHLAWILESLPQSGKCFRLLWVAGEVLLVEQSHEWLALIAGLHKPVGWKADARKINKGSEWQAKWNLRHQWANKRAIEWVSE